MADQDRQRTAVRHLKAYFGDAEIEKIGPLESRAYVAARREGVVGGGKRRRGRGAADADRTQAQADRAAAEATAAVTAGDIDAALAARERFTRYSEKAAELRRQAETTRRTYLHASDNTIRRELNCLVAAFNHAVKWGNLPNDIRCRVELPAESRGEGVKWLTKDQIRDALRAADGELRDFILLAYYTGARRKSIESLTRFQVDLVTGHINLMPPGARTTKKRKPIVPIYPEIRPTIERLLDASGSEYLFDRRRSFYRDFVRLMARIGIDAHPHMLRHSRASHMLMDGEGVWKVAKLLGDTITTVERVYAHVNTAFLATESNVG